MSTHTVAEAKNQLSKLIDRAVAVISAPKGRNETSSACARRGLYAWVRRLPFCNFLQYLMSDPLY
jgi:hypothetical protein